MAVFKYSFVVRLTLVIPFYPDKLLLFTHEISYSSTFLFLFSMLFILYITLRSPFLTCLFSYIPQTDNNFWNELTIPYIGIEWVKCIMEWKRKVAKKLKQNLIKNMNQIWEYYQEQWAKYKGMIIALTKTNLLIEKRRIQYK